MEELKWATALQSKGTYLTAFKLFVMHFHNVIDHSADGTDVSEQLGNRGNRKDSDYALKFQGVSTNCFFVKE